MLSDFTVAFTDADAGDQLEKIKVTSLPSQGDLQLSGVSVTQDQEITAAEIHSGLLTFVPATDFVGAASFDWSAYDGEDWSTCIKISSK